MKAKKLDRRHSGYSMFKWAIDFTHKENLEFCQIREWLWEQFGPSCELEFCYKFNKNVDWAWINDQHRLRIYIKSDKEYQWFLLKWQ